MDDLLVEPMDPAAKKKDPTAEAQAYAQAQAAQGVADQDIMAAVAEKWPDANMPLIKKSIIAGKAESPDKGGRYPSTVQEPIARF